MALYKRGRTWWCEWKVGAKRIRETTGTTSRQEAQEYHDRRRADLWRASKLGDTRVPLWQEAATDWAVEHAQHKKSYETDRLRLLFLTNALNDIPLTNITTDTLTKLRAALMEGGRAHSTANRYLAVASAVLHFAHEKGWLPKVPKIPYLPEPQERFRWLTKEQALKLIAELPEHLALITRFALATGLRRANITGLTWHSIDISRKIAWIWPDEAKAGKPIAVPLNSDALAVLQECQGKNARFIFTYKGKPVKETTTKAWFKAIERAGIDPEFTFHDLRHTWASWHVMNGTPLEVLRQLGGWADIKMVLRYAHLAPGYVASYAENVALTISPTHPGNVSEDYRVNADNLGWLIGLEPTTTGITIPQPNKKAA